MRKIRIAQIGTSKYSHGNEIFGSLCANSEAFEVVGYALPEGERVKFPDKMKRFAPYREMTVEEILADETIEAVSIETEEIYLTKYALMAAEAGKHIHMEKPGGISLEDFERLILVMKKTGKVFHTGYMYRYDPVISDIIKRVREGEIGDVISVEAQMSGWRGFDQTKWLETFPGGMMFYLGCHLVDLVLQLQGEPKRVIPFNKSSGVHPTEAQDNSFALLEYDRGVSFVKTTQAEMGGFKRRQLVVTVASLRCAPWKSALNIRCSIPSIPSANRRIGTTTACITDPRITTDIIRCSRPLQKWSEVRWKTRIPTTMS